MEGNKKQDLMQSQSFGRTGYWIVPAFCGALISAWTLEHFISNQSTLPESAPVWIPLVAALVTAVSILLNDRPGRLHLQRILLWSGILLMIWSANGLPFDLFSLTGLIPVAFYWPGFVTRTLALAITIMLARIVFVRPAVPESARPATWYGYAAFVFALPYPVIWTYWALGGTLGLTQPDSAVHKFLSKAIISPFIIPWLLGAVLSLLLVSTSRWKPRRLLLVAGWSATAIVAMIGPGACWMMVTKLIKGGDFNLGEIGLATWVPFLFYGSWFLWAIATGAATWSYQLRSTNSENSNR